MTAVRPFAGSLADAEGILAVERATFDESPYTPHAVATLLTGGERAAWVAVAGDTIVGFVIAFPTYGLAGPRWEVDLLAVRPGWRGQGLATRLIGAACAHGTRIAPVARAVVATDNRASLRAFQRAGFQPAAHPSELFILRLTDVPSRPVLTVGVSVRDADGVHELAPWLQEHAPSGVPVQPHPGTALLVAEHQVAASSASEPAGYAELLWVRTLLYAGVWIESLAAAGAAPRAALVREAVGRALARGLDEVGAMVPAGDAEWHATMRAAGFQSLGEFVWLVARLPLPGRAEGGAGEGISA
ncbi:MAG: GNAT family N-acetyltransferase [Anaerolineae bacterium]|nr:GNAT family N-acetyltransferase [Anaerolineae bacterium]